MGWAEIRGIGFLPLRVACARSRVFVEFDRIIVQVLFCVVGRAVVSGCKNKMSASRARPFLGLRQGKIKMNVVFLLA